MPWRSSGGARCERWQSLNEEFAEYQIHFCRVGSGVGRAARHLLPFTERDHRFFVLEFDIHVRDLLRFEEPLESGYVRLVRYVGQRNGGSY